MDLNAGLKNIHYDKYIAKAYAMLNDIGVELLPPQRKIA
jgi:hypothetical protein